MSNLDILRQSSLIGTTLRAASGKSHAFSTNYHAYIAMPTWHRCAPPILLWHWPLFNLFPSSCVTLIFFVDSHWWVPLRVQYPTIYMPFRQIIMYILQCPHDIHVLVHLCCFELHKFLLCSHAANMPHLELWARDIPVLTGACFYCYANVCSVMRSCCPEIFAGFIQDPPPPKYEKYLFIQ